MDETHRLAAVRLRADLAVASPAPEVFRAALTAVPPHDRDAWIDLVLGIDGVAEDGPDLPLGCVPYLPCAVDTLLEMVARAAVTSRDVFVDVGAGVGRAAALTHLVSGAATIGVEIQARLASRLRELGRRVPGARLSVVEGDAAHVTGQLTRGTVFFLYCPFGGERLAEVLRGLGAIAARREIRVCCVDLPLPPCPWLTRVAGPEGALAIYRSTPLRLGPA